VTSIVDQFHDPSFRILYSIIQDHPEAEQHFKSASIDEEQHEKRASSCFAWEDERLFPVDTPAQAALSRYYMHKQAGVPDHAVQRCDKALELYGVTLQFSQEKTAAAEDPDEYLLPTIKRFRVRNAEETKLAADALETHKRNMSPETRALAAVNLVKKAVAQDQTLPAQIYKSAGLTACHVPTMRDWVEARAQAAEDPTIRKAYMKIAEAARTKEAYFNDRDELIKVAGVISELDEAAGLQKHYNKRLPDPMDTVFNTDKIAEEQVELAGKPVPLSKLLSVDPEIYKDVFGEDLTDEFIEADEVDPEQLKVILPTVPLDLQQALLRSLGM